MTKDEEDALIKEALGCLDPRNALAMSAASAVYPRIRLAIRAAVAQESQWREAVLNELIVAHIYTKEHDTNPRKAIQDAITWNCQVALDPAVSSYAQKLVAQERERCAKVCEEPNLICCGSPAINDHGIYGIETGCCGCPEREEKTAIECAAAIRRGE